MNYFHFPLSENELRLLQLDEAATKLVKANAPPSEWLRSIRPSVKEELSELNWFLTFLDDRAIVRCLAQKSGSTYIVIRSNRPKEDGMVFLSIQSTFADTPRVISGRCGYETYRPAILMLVFLRSSFDSIDMGRAPFVFGGEKGTELADFTHPTTLAHSAKWGRAIAFYTSPGGDTVLVNSNGSVAWHQIETNKIIVAGTFEEVVKRYFELTFTNSELSSW